MHLYKFKYSRESNNQTKVSKYNPTNNKPANRKKKINPELTKDKETKKKKIVEKNTSKGRKGNSPIT